MVWPLVFAAVVGLAAFSVGYKAGHKDGLVDAPSHNAVLVEKEKTAQLWQAEYLAEPSERERICDQFFDAVEAYVLDDLGAQYQYDPGGDDGR